LGDKKIVRLKGVQGTSFFECKEREADNKVNADIKMGYIAP
jgi:hypothetical protein